MPVTLKELAERLGVSAATVSMALNDRRGVNPDTRQKVLALARELHYDGNYSAGKNKGVLNFLVYRRHGKVVAETQFFTELIEAVEHAARALNYNITLAYCAGRSQAEELALAARAARPHGLLLLGTEMEEDDLAPFLSLGIPTVLLDCSFPEIGLDQILINNRCGIGQAVHCLCEHGHRNIGYLHSSISIRNFEQRAEAYSQALAGLKLPLREDWFFALAPSVEGACEDFGRLLEKRGDLPTAFVADNDIIAAGAMKALKAAGYRIPEDISVVGFDNVPLCNLTEPELTSIDVPRRVLGETAVHQLMRRIRRPGLPFVQMTFGTALVERQSVRQPDGPEART